MCQKVLVADTIAKTVIPLLDEPSALQFAGGWLGARRLCLPALL